MNILIIAAALPPQLDGIGDYSASLASELATRPEVSVQIFTGQGNAHPIEGVTIEPAFSTTRPVSLGSALASRIQEQLPGWILLQYNPFWYGNRGWNPYLPLALRSLRRSSENSRLAVMVHEPFMPAISANAAVMSLYQRWQFWTLGRAADVMFFSIEAWAKRFRSWFPGKMVEHLPVSSNIPLGPMSRSEARARLSLQNQTIALGLFGTAAGGRMLGHVREAAEAIIRAGKECCLVYVGPDGAEVRRALQPIPVHDCGPLAARGVSETFAAFDIYLAPFIDGISTRRTNFMTALQHGRAIVGTCGALTDSLLTREDGMSFVLTEAHAKAEFAEAVLELATKPARRELLGAAASALFEREFTWPRIASRQMATLKSVPAK